ncbi:hypothetical protein BA059_27070 [Mycolicibacterium sp. (ex Dasyatis americana)]|nr:hypothetical protein BA059_27070 [Mycolicibacterium sp. (ex Dasyatis americana)]
MSTYRPVPKPRPSVVLERVVKSFGDTVAVDDVDLEVQPGEVIAVLGANGAGKTTVLEICEGFLSPDRGKVRVLGLDPVADRDRLRPRLGIMPQGGAGYPGIRAGEMLSLAASCARNPLDIAWLMHSLGLVEFAKTKYRHLSGGQRQRVSLACALVGRPEVVFLDEPTEGLDVAARQMAWNLIRHLAADGVTVVLSTHQIDEAEALADRVVILDSGRIVIVTAPDHVALGNEPNELTFCAPRGLNLGWLVAELDERFSADELSAGRYRLRGPISPSTVGTVTAWGATRGVLLSHIVVNRCGLEDHFLELTRPR